MSYPDAIRPALEAAMNSSDPDQIISGVKGIVASELEKLSPGVQIEYTNYFNHTYMPDMVLTWSGRHEETRPVFLRNSLRISSALTDVRGLKNMSPVVLGLRPVDRGVENAVRESRSETQRVFVTDVASIDQAGQSSPNASEASAPLLSIVRNNILRTGRGVMTAENATELVAVTERVAANDPETASVAFNRFEALAGDLLAEDGAYQVTRAGRLIRALQSADYLAEFTENADGRLSESDIANLLPVLLQRDSAGDKLGAKFWNAVARLTALEDLESLPELEGTDITPLAQAAVEWWESARVELVYNNDYDEEQPQRVPAPTSWRIFGGKLLASVGPWNLVFVSEDKRRLKGASDSREANWSDISSALRSLVVESATLRGVVRRLTIDAEESSNVVRDIESVTSTLDDTYRVQQLVVRLPDSESGVEVDFKKMLSTVKHGTAPLDELGTITLRLLGHRMTVQPTWLKDLGPLSAM